MGFLLLQLHKNVTQRFRDLLILGCICVVKRAEHVESYCCCPFDGILVLGCHGLQGAEDSTHGRLNHEDGTFIPQKARSGQYETV